MPSGQADYQDDPSIKDTCQLLRRIPLKPSHCIWDENLRRYRPTSASFEDHPNGSPMSVTLADELLASHRSLEDGLAGLEGYALAGISAGFVRELGLGVAGEPLDDEPAHAVVLGKKSKKIRSALAKAAIWVVAPPNSSTS